MTPLLTWDWPSTPIELLVIVVIASLAVALTRRAVRAAVTASVKAAELREGSRILPSGFGARHEARVTTMGELLGRIVAAAIVIVAVLMALQSLGVPMAPLLGGLGVVGVAMGLGAQSVIKDVLAGIFMVLEDQYGVGDLVTLDDKTGTVESIGLRVTRIVDPSGQIWYLRNGELTVVGNQTQGNSTADVSVPIGSDEDAAAAIAVLNQVADELFADPAFADVLLERPFVAGVDRLGAGEIVLRTFAKTRPNQQWGVQREFLSRAQAALRQAGFRGPQVVAAPPVPDA